MYMYFTIFGILFVSCFATVTNFLYDFFPINKFTNFFKPLGKGIWHKISDLVLPTILWSFIELPILGNLKLFWIATVLNLCIGSSLMYVIKYGSYVLLKKENNIINLISIYVSTIVSYLLSYFMFMLSSVNNHYIIISIVILLICLLIYIIVNLFPPKSEFFRGYEK